MKIGVILAHFQPVGKRPDAIDRLNNFVRLGAMEAAVECSMAADILSGPVDFAVLSRDLVFSAEETRWADTWVKWIWVTHWIKGVIKTPMEEVIE